MGKLMQRGACHEMCLFKILRKLEVSLNWPLVDKWMRSPDMHRESMLSLYIRVKSCNNCQARKMLFNCFTTSG